jgi:hypothetical protein
MVLARTTGYIDHLVKTDIKNTMVRARNGYMDHLEDRHKEHDGTG